MSNPQPSTRRPQDIHTHHDARPLTLALTWDAAFTTPPFVFFFSFSSFVLLVLVRLASFFSILPPATSSLSSFLSQLTILPSLTGSVQHRGLVTACHNCPWSHNVITLRCTTPTNSKLAAAVKTPPFAFCPSFCVCPSFPRPASLASAGWHAMFNSFLVHAGVMGLCFRRLVVMYSIFVTTTQL